MLCNPYLIFNGTCEQAFKLYEGVLGGRITAMYRFGETPASGQADPAFADKIMHATLQFGDNYLMASDAPPQHFAPMQGMSVSLNVHSVEDAERIFAALADGGLVKMPIQQTFWAERFGMLTDRFGTPWMINFEKKQK
jgi:PhnB protein